MRLFVFALSALVTGLSAAEIRLESPGVQVTLNSEAGYGITSLRDVATGRDFISPDVRLPLYRITLSRPDGTTTEITSASASSVSPRQTPAGATLVFEHPAERIICMVRADAAASRVSWKIAIRNQGPFGVRSLFYPQWPAPLRLTNSPRQNKLLYPFLDGQEFVDPGDRMPVGRMHRTLYP